MKNVSFMTIIIVAFLSTAQGCTLGTAPECDTSVAAGLTSQLVSELASMGIAFAELSDQDRFRCSEPCVPFLQEGARDALASATASVGDYITLNSAYRSSAQQYLLYLWFLNKSCNIKAAAKPGTSNHEGGLGIDTSFYAEWLNTLSAYSWSWLGDGDPPHFDYVGDATPGVPQQSLLAFQRLWNRNNPSDQIAEDGIYGDESAARLSASPCSGW